MKKVGKRTASLFLALIMVLGAAPLFGFIGVNDVFVTTAEAASSGYTVIWSPNDLNNIRNNLSGNYILANDIDMSKFGNWEPIGDTSSPFTGTLNGNGHSIKNLTVELTSNTPNGEDTVNAGFIGTSNGAHISNLGVEDSYISHTQTGSTSDTASFCNASGIVGVANNSTIEKCFFTGEVRSVATKYAFARSSGIALCNGSTVRNCYVDADIYSKGYSANTMVGGIAAWNEGSVVDKCYAAGTIYAESTKAYVYLGGIVGSGSGTVSNSVVLFDSVKYSGTTTSYWATLVDAVCPFSTLTNNKALSSVISSVANKSATSISISNAKSSSTYTAIGWDFDSVWQMGNTYPMLITNESGYKDKFNNIEEFANAEFTVNVLAYGSTQDVESEEPEIAVDGAEVSIYLGKDRVGHTYSENGIAIFTKDNIDTTKDMDYLIKNATVSAHLSAGNDIELCSERVTDRGVWEGERLSEYVNNGKALVCDEPRWNVPTLRVMINESDEKKCKKILKEYSSLFAQSTNGHVIVNSFELMVVPDELSNFTQDELTVTTVYQNVDICMIRHDDVGAFRGYIEGEPYIWCPINNSNCAKTLCHESGHYLLNFYDEYASAIGYHESSEKYQQLGEDNYKEKYNPKDYNENYAYDWDRNGVLENKDETSTGKEEKAAHWSTKANKYKWKGSISRPDGAPENFGLMEAQEYSIELSTKSTYNKISINSVQDQTLQYYLNKGLSCEETMADLLDDMSGYPTNFTYATQEQTAQYFYAGGDNVTFTPSSISSASSFSTFSGEVSEVLESDATEILSELIFDYDGLNLNIASSKKTEIVAYDVSGNIVWETVLNDENGYESSFATEINSCYIIGAVEFTGESNTVVYYYVDTTTTEYGSDLRGGKKTFNLVSQDTTNIAIISTDNMICADGYTPLSKEHRVLCAGGTEISGRIEKSVAYNMPVDYSSMTWFFKADGDWAALDTFIGFDDHGNPTASCTYAGEGSYCLMAKNVAETILATPTGFAVTTGDVIYDGEVIATFNDSDENVMYYNIFYGTEPITAENYESLEVQIAYSSQARILFENSDTTYYFAIQAVGIDGSKSAISESVTCKGALFDSNSDGLPDCWISLYPTIQDLEDIPGTDSDDDGLTNIQEYEYGTNPLNPDTDGDNVYDIIEMRNDTNPLEPMTDGVTDDYTIVYGIPNVFIDETSFIVDETTVTCTISNNTDGKAMRTHIYLYDAEGELLELNEVNLDSNSSVDYSFSKEYFVDGMRIVIDEEEITRDSDYSNNEFVYVPATGIAATTSEVTVVKGKTAQLEYMLTPEDASKIVEWKSSDETVVTVSKRGLVTGVKIGTATITATTLTGFTCSYEILVEPFAGAGLTDFDCTLINSETEVRIIGYVGSELNVVIPEQIAGYPVTSLANGAFVNENIESISIPSTVSEIQTQAFKCVTNFKSVTVDSANSNFCSVDGVLFNYDQTEIVVYPPAIEYSGYKIPDTVLTVKPYAFYKAQNLKTVDLNNVQDIKEYAFDYSALTSITIPEQVTILGKSAFYNCADLTDVYFNAVNCDCSFSPNAFTFLIASAKTNHVFSSTVTNVNLGKNVQVVDSGIFGLVSITDLTIPESVKTIKAFSFKNAKNLADIYYDGSARIWNEISLGSNSGLTDATMHYGKFTATFISEGETLSKVDYKPGEIIATPDSVPEKKYYTFVDWTPEVPDTMPEYDLEFTAVFELSDATRTVEYYVDGELYFSEYRFEGEEVTIPESPSKEGYTFVKWTPDVAETMPDENLVYEAVWNTNVHQVSFIVDGETYHSYECAYSDVVTTPDDPIKEGYTFVGWTPAVPESMPDMDMEFTAVFEAITYTATFMDGETVVGTDEFTVEDTELDLSVVEYREGYEYVYDEYEIVANDLIINGGYEIITYTATFVIDGETVSVQEFTVENMTFEEPEITQKDGYAVAWEEYEIKLANFTVNAIYTPIVYTATFMDGETVVGTDEFTVEDTALDYPETTAKEHYDWVWDDYEIIADNITVNGEYVPTTYTASFTADGAVVDEVEFNIENQSVVAPEVPKKSGYTVAWEEYEITLSDFTVSAIYTPIVYTATFTHNGETIGTDEFTIEDVSLDYPDIAEKEYYEWVWDEHSILANDITIIGNYVPITYTINFVSNGITKKTQQFNVETTDSIMPPSFSLAQKAGYDRAWESWEGKICNLTVNEVYVPIVYSARFWCNGNLIRTCEFTVETKKEHITMPTLTEREGYQVIWSNFEIAPNDIDVYGEYVPIEYTAQFIADGEVISTQTFTVETESLNEPPVPQKAGYYARWSSYEIEAKDIKIVAKYHLPEVVVISKRTLDVGDIYRLLPSCNFEITEKTWTSSDTSVATVNQHGKITAVGKGECEITTTCYGKDSLGNDIQASKTTKIIVNDNSETNNSKRSFRELFDEFFEVTLHDLVYNLKEFMIVLFRYAY